MKAAEQSGGRPAAGAILQAESPELILVGLEAESAHEVVLRLASRLEARGYVRPSFAQAVLEREQEFPTGLPTADVQVALPHTDVEHCLRPGLAVATLARPVRFTEMATHDRAVAAEIVFLLSIVEPSEQVKWLQRLVTLFQTAGFLRELHRTPDPQSCAALLRLSLSAAGE
jgi:PTS system galactitol-specific IIA component